MKKIQTTNRKPFGGYRRPGVGYIYIFVFMFIAIVAGTALSGGNIPVDPNSPEGPPTLPPYFEESGHETQKIILPSGALTPDPRNNLQLKTFHVNTCGQKMAIDFLIDTSGSMEDYNKMDKLKNALNQFTKKFSGRSAISMQTFSKDVQEKVSFGLYSDKKLEVEQTINSLTPNGWTSTRDGFQKAKEVLKASIDSKQFPGYHYVLVLMTDGVPEIPSSLGQRTCYVQTPDPFIKKPDQRCFAKEQDPRVPTNIADEIKSMGVKIYSVGIFSQLSSDLVMEPYLKELLQNVASTPSEPLQKFFYTSVEANDMQSIFTSIFDQFCDDEVETGTSKDPGAYDFPSLPAQPKPIGPDMN